jgi:hypothetical protein
MKAVQKITKEIGRFDVCALLKALEHAGLTLSEIFFLANTSYASPSSLCQCLVVHQKTPSFAHLTVNFGLLSPSSPLASYFRKQMEKELIQEEKFTAFLRFFDHHLIENLIHSIWPEKFLLPKRPDLFSSHFNLLSLKSKSTVFWLWRLCFPELKVTVERVKKAVKFPIQHFRLGKNLLDGKSALGGYATFSFYILSITLFVEEKKERDRPPSWPVEIKRRLQTYIAPIMRKSHAYISCFVFLPHDALPVYLDGMTLLGYGKLGKSHERSTIRLFEGFF